MAFNDIELMHIKKTVGKMCERRSPSELRDQLRTIYEIEGHDVTVYEERPRYNNPKEWFKEPVAKLKYVRKDNIWKLYWMRRDLKWHSYAMPLGARTLEALIEEVDSDPHGAFWG